MAVEVKGAGEVACSALYSIALQDRCIIKCPTARPLMQLSLF